MFGDYVEAHDENKTTNSMKPRTEAAIYMRPTGNFQGLIKLSCLETGNQIVQQICTRLPMPDSAIHQMEELASQDKATSGIIQRQAKTDLNGSIKITIMKQ